MKGISLANITANGHESVDPSDQKLWDKKPLRDIDDFVHKTY